MRERIRATRNTLLEHWRDLEPALSRDTRARTAAYSFVRRAQNIDQAIWCLLDEGCLTEAAILLRTQLNLLWCFLFLVDARSIAGRFEFEPAPAPLSQADRRMARYLSWHWVDLHRRSPSERSREMMDRVVREHGFAAEADVPKYWYQERGINTIKDVAVAVGATEQYEQDYTHLSGVEHTDITATIVQDLCGPRYGDFIGVKSSYVFLAVLDFCVRMCAPERAARFTTMVDEFNLLTDQVSQRERERGA